MKKASRRALLSIGIMVPLLLGTSACSPASPPPASPSASTATQPARVFDKTESPIAAAMYEKYLNKLYTVQASEIQAVIDPLVSDGELSAADTTKLVSDLNVSFPELFGAFNIKGLTDDQSATLFYSVFSLVKTLNEEQVKAVVTVPSSAVLVNGNSATVNAKQVVAKSEGNVLSLGDAPTKVDLIKIGDKWFISPPSEIINPSK